MNLSTLNPMQRVAVETTEGPLLVVAGAGSGKTRVLTHRIAYLIEEKRVFPSNILAFTFTNKAAQEMKDRVSHLVGGESYGMWMGTFHSICVRILRGDAERIGYKSDFVIYDTSDQKVLVKECMKELNIDDKKLPVNSVLYRISGAKNDMVSPEAFEDEVSGQYPDELVAKVYKRYQTKIFKNNAMDFDDLIGNTLRLFDENPDVLAHYQQKFRYVHVDEYQDTNKAQYELINHLASGSGNLCVVGDADQSIYGWRGADIRNIYEFEKDFDRAKVIKLEQNYRSTKKILAVANAVIEKNQYRKDKNLWTENEDGDQIRYYQAMDEYGEAKFAVSEIQNLYETEGRRYNEFAVLYRTNAQSRVFEDVLLKNNIPYKIVGGLKFYERKEIKDVMAYMKVIQNPVDDVSFMRVVNVPKRGIGAKTLERIAEHALTQDLSMYQSAGILVQEGIFSKKATDGLKSFLGFVETYSQMKTTASAHDIYSGIVEHSGYVAELRLENTIESQSRIENIKEFESVIQEFEAIETDKSLENFLAMTTLKSDVDGLEEVEQGVLLMTLHSAKGLEFPVVFLVGLEEGIFPSGRSLEDDEGIEEERRLCYVGITRAEEVLYLSHAQQRSRFGRTEVNLPSRFLGDIPREYVYSFNGEVASSTRQKISFPGDLGSNKSSGFSGAQYAKPSIEKTRKITAVDEAVEAEGIILSPGSKVLHNAFGEGTVINYDEASDIITIVFETRGVKKLQRSMAPLKALL
ncbi:MAG: DNA helicase PcrA [Clostridia bacterium]|nr:DNA helicase PcrA [Clostridia bacterium]